MFKYFILVLEHKWVFFKLGKLTHLPLGLRILHDWSKFLPDEFIPHARALRVGKELSYDHSTPGFEDSFWLHLARNKHHWEYWLLADSVPNVYLREMVTDWLATAAQPGHLNTWSWYAENYFVLILLPHERKVVEGWLANILGPYAGH